MGIKDVRTPLQEIKDGLRDKNMAGGPSEAAVEAAAAAKNKLANMKEEDEEVADMRRRQGFKKTLNTLQTAITPGKYAKGGRVTGFKGYGKAKKV